MKLHKANKRFIDSQSYKALLTRWRYSRIDNAWFEGETGAYIGKRIKDLKPSNHIQISKEIDKEYAEVPNEVMKEG